MLGSGPEKYVHIHIPKTGGTSLRALFMSAYGANNTLQWVEPLNGFVRTSELRIDPVKADRLRNIAKSLGIFGFIKRHVQTADNLRSVESIKLDDLSNIDFKVATGHVKTTQITASDTGLPITAIVREPLDRAWSHYRYWQSSPHTIVWHPPEINDKANTPFEEFALHPAVSNFQALWLGTHPVMTLGTLETLPDFLEQVGIDTAASIPRLNAGKPASLPHVGSSFRHEFENTHKLDYELYEAARETRTVEL